MAERPSGIVSRAAGALVALVGVVILIGCAVDLSAVKSVAPGWVSMKPNSALGFVLSGAALWLLTAEPDADATRRWGRTAGMACASTAALLGLLTLAEYLLGWDLHIDQMLFRDAAPATPTYAPGRMAPAAALCLLLQGTALLLLDARVGKALWPAQALTSTAALGALLGALTYLYGVTALDRFALYTRMAFHTALTFLPLSAGILSSRPRRGWMVVLSSDATGGAVARRLLPVIFGVPVALGWLRLQGERAGLFRREFGVSLTMLAVIILLAVVVLHLAGTLNRGDVERREAARVLAESERRYRQLTDASLDAVVVADSRGLIRLFNPAAERIFGYSAAEALGMDLALLAATDLREGHREGFARYVRTREARVIGRTRELRGRRKDGSEITLELSLSVLNLGDDIQFLGTIRDLTERKRMRDAVQRSERLASIGMLTAGIAHEINNPLAYVGNNLAVLERDTRGVLELMSLYEDARAVVSEADPAAAERIRQKTEKIDLAYFRENFERLMGRTRSGVDRVARIVQSMRALARMGPPQVEETSLGEVVESSLEMIRGQLKRRGIEVVVDCGQAPRLRCEVTQIGQVVLNLLVNAEQSIMAARREGNGRIDIVARATESEVHLEVRDNGTGIPADDLPRIFDPFFTTKPVGEGMGLGLSLANAIITAHGGRIEVESKLTEGTCFRIVLPLHSAGGPS